VMMGGGQGLSRLTSSVEVATAAGDRALLEVLEGRLALVALSALRLALALRQRRERAGRWSLG